MAEYVSVRMRKETYQKLKEAAGGAPMTQFFEVLAAKPATSQDKVEAIHQKHVEELKDGPRVQEGDWRDDFEEVDTSDWVLGLCPECCIDFIMTQNPKDACEHWKQGKRTKRDGSKTHDWKNTVTGRFVWERYYDPIRLEYADPNYGYGD